MGLESFKNCLMYNELSGPVSHITHNAHPICVNTTAGKRIL